MTGSVGAERPGTPLSLGDKGRNPGQARPIDGLSRLARAEHKMRLVLIHKEEVGCGEQPAHGGGLGLGDPAVGADRQCPAASSLTGGDKGGLSRSRAQGGNVDEVVSAKIAWQPLWVEFRFPTPRGTQQCGAPAAVMGNLQPRKSGSVDERAEPVYPLGRPPKRHGPRAQSGRKQRDLGPRVGDAEGGVQARSPSRLERGVPGQMKHIQRCEPDNEDSWHGDRHNTRMPRLTRNFFARDSVAVARDLIGARLAIAVPGAARLEGVIVETEAYAPNDQASHAFRGPTPRNAAMFGPAGHAYVYFVYGMHFCLNVVTEVEGIGAAVLLRALRPVAGVENMQRNRGTRTALAEAALCRGPGNLCRALGIDRTFNGLDLCASGAPLRLYAPSGPVEIGVSVRIGVSGDALAREAPWRFFAVGDPAVSRHPGGKAAAT